MKTQARKIRDYSVDFCGIDNCQYWQGAGVAYTPWIDCVTGIGDNAGEALADALEMLAQHGEWDIDSVDWKQDEESAAAITDSVSDLLETEDGADCESFDGEMYYYVVIYVK